MKPRRYIVETLMSYGWDSVWSDDDGNAPTFATREEAQAEIDDHIMTQCEMNMTVDELRIVPEPVDVQATWRRHGWVPPDRRAQYAIFTRLNAPQK